MSHILIYLFPITVLFVSNVTFAQPDSKISSKTNPQHFAVVELFTSEGCSSCPPADKLLAELVRNEKENSRNIFPISFHVDYWNYIGWTDPFSDPAYSDRQRKYAAAFRTARIYTPQMIVNGKVEFVGSDKGTAKERIEDALRQPAQVELYLDLELSEDRKELSIEYKVKGFGANQVLNIAIVERGLSSQVTKGENRNRMLNHENVVRKFVTLKISHSGNDVVKIKIPQNIKIEKSSIVAFIQNQKSMEILGSVGLDL